MQVSIETTSGLERRLTVGVPAERVDSEVDSRLQKEARNVRLPGFRPGKVPMKVMRQRFGAGVRQQVLGEVMSQSFQEAVIQEKLRPAGQPSIEPRNLEAGKDIDADRAREIGLINEVYEDGEKEYLFSAFSVFTVTEVKPSRTPTRIGTPHIITIAPALDNKLQPGPDGRICETKWPPGLPLAPWC